MGWFPSDFGLKDHTVFKYQDYYYLASIYLASNHNEDRFAYARSEDLCDWEELTPIMTQRTAATWDEFKIWAPFVYEENNNYYMYYTGVTKDFTQSIMLAISADPSTPTTWQSYGMVFQPSHLGAMWQTGLWADCRDPMVIKIENTYYLYYTARDETGGIIGLATATSPLGPWEDWGAILTLSTPTAMAESPTLKTYQGLYYLFYNDTSQGERYRVGASAAGPWSSDAPLKPGWAHEVWQGLSGDDYTSFLTGYKVTISRLTWDTIYEVPRPFIGESVYHLWLPFNTR